MAPTETASLVTNAGPTAELGSGGSCLTDSATLAVGPIPPSSAVNNPILTFNLYAPADTTYAHPVYSTSVPVTSNGTYNVNSPGSTNPGGYVPTVTGHVPVVEAIHG